MNPVSESLLKIYERDLARLEEEIKLCPTEASLWTIRGEVKNSAGNLTLHLCGNLQYYIGAVLGSSGYVRNRELEFAARNVPLKDLLLEIQRTKKAVQRTMERIDSYTLEQEYPMQVFSYTMTTTFFLIHLAAHLGYHLGQVNYLRRLL